MEQSFDDQLQALAESNCANADTDLDFIMCVSLEKEALGLEG